LCLLAREKEASVFAMTARQAKAAKTRPTPDKLIARVQSTSGQRGVPTPEITVTLPAGWPYRRLKAMLYGLAMGIEAITPRGEGWVTEIEVLGDGHGRVYLDLVGSDQDEVSRARALLEDVVQRQLDFVRGDG